MTEGAALLEEARAAAVGLFGLKEPELSHMPGGRVNESFLAESGGRRFVLQRINDLFQASVRRFIAPAGPGPLPVDTTVGDNWRAVVQAVAERSGLAELPIPSIFPALNGGWLASFDGEASAGLDGCWRLTAFVEGRPAPKDSAGAAEAAGLLGFFHRQLNRPLPIDLRPLPEGDFTNQHLSSPPELEQIFDDYRGHPRLGEIKGLVERAIQAAGGLLARPDFIAVFSLRDVVIHGDPKADNFLFSPEGKALCLLDWDSVGLGHVLVDVAELMRSWASFGNDGRPKTECLAAAVESYASSGLDLNLDEVEMLPAVLRAIVLNLCRRYLVDSLAQVYFRWDRQAYPSLFHQNLSRAEGMLRAAEWLMENEIDLGRLLAERYTLGRQSA